MAATPGAVPPLPSRIGAYVTIGGGVVEDGGPVSSAMSRVIRMPPSAPRPPPASATQAEIARASAFGVFALRQSSTSATHEPTPPASAPAPAPRSISSTRFQLGPYRDWSGRYAPSSPAASPTFR